MSLRVPRLLHTLRPIRLPRPRPSFLRPHLSPPLRHSSSSTPPDASTPSPVDLRPDSTPPPSHLNAAEAEIYSTLWSSEKLSPTALEVQDISGGCGSMYALSVTSEAFRGLSVIKQHRLVNGVLGDRVKGWHGLQVRCFLPE